MAYKSTPTEGSVESEAHIIARAKAGDADAISLLYERYAPQVRRYIASRLGDPVLAEDVCSDVFVKMLEGLDRYERSRLALLRLALPHRLCANNGYAASGAAASVGSA